MTEIREIIAQLIAHHGDTKTLSASSGISAITWQRWAAGIQAPRANSKIRAAEAFTAAGLVSPWSVDQKPRRQEVEIRPLFDLATLEPLAVPVVFQPAVWSGLAKPIVETLAEASLCSYSIEEDRGGSVVLKDRSIQGGTLTTWKVVGVPTQSYALRLTDGRLVEYVQGSAVSLNSDTAARKAARASRRAA